MTREPVLERYRDASGARHEVVVSSAPEGAWQVLDLDVDTDTAHVVDTLDGDQDGRPQAEAIARDYLTTVDDRQPGTGSADGEAIPESGGSDARSHRRTDPASRARRERGAALPGAAR
jgi:hypothetical protein